MSNIYFVIQVDAIKEELAMRQAEILTSKKKSLQKRGVCACQDCQEEV